MFSRELSFTLGGHLMGHALCSDFYFLPSKFECVACGLKISSLSQLHAAGLGDTYKATYVYEASDYFKSSDEYEGYEPDFNEP